MANAKYMVCLEPTHWTPIDERIAISASANNLASAEFVFDAICKQIPTDGVEYAVELFELLSDDSLKLHKSSVFGEPLVAR